MISWLSRLREATSTAVHAEEHWNPLQGLPRHIERRERWTRGLGLGLLVGMIVALFNALDTFDAYEAGTYRLRLDARVSTAALAPPLGAIALIVIDDRSCDPSWHGGCPPLRADTATVIDRLHAAGARMLILDQLYESSKDGTAALAAALRRAGNVILAQRLLQSSQLGATSISLKALEPSIQRAALGVGLANISCEAGARLVEHYPLGCSWAGEWQPSMALVAYRHLTGQRTTYQAGSSIYLNYAGLPLETYPTYSYRSILETPQCVTGGRHVRCAGQVGPDLWDNLRGKTVLVGRSDSEAPDLFDDPFGLRPHMPGVQVEATALNTLLNHDPIIVPPDWLDWILIAAAAVALAAVATAFALGIGITLGLGALLAYNLLAFLALGIANVHLLVAAPDAAIAASFLLVLGARYVLEEREKHRTQATFARFVSPAVVEDIMENPTAIAAGKRGEIAVLFTDIRGFTTLSEYSEPEMIMGALRTYFTSMVAIVHEHGGTVDKFIGDGLMALFGAPVPIDNPSLAALRAALAMQRAMVAVNRQVEEPLGATLRIGVGINYGEAVFGLSGAPSKLEFTALGDTVNMAARLESLCRDKGYSIVLSETAYEQLPDDPRHGLLDLGVVNVKGRQASIRVYGVPASVDDPQRPAASSDDTTVGAGTIKAANGALTGANGRAAHDAAAAS